MNKVNIFDNENAKPLDGTFFSFAKVGDAIQGTYVSQHRGTDTFGNAQTIYVLIDNEGKVWNCGFRDTSVTGQIIATRMVNAVPGVIVGFRFDSEKPSKVKPGVMAKVINAYFDSKVVDTAWLARQKEIGTSYTQPVDASNDDNDFTDDLPDFNAPSTASASTGAAVSTEEKSVNTAIDAIRNLAKTKGLTNETMSEADADNVIEVYTQLSLTEENLTKIIIALTGYVAK